MNTLSADDPAMADRRLVQAKRSQRINWLRRNPKKVSSLTRRELVNAMKASGLLSLKTQDCDVNVYNLLRDAGYPRRVQIKFSRAPFLHG